MKLKDLFLPIILLSVGLVFVAISCLVILSNGKNKKLIESKMKIGAFLLTFSWFAAGCGQTTNTCYVPAQPDDIIQIKPKNSEIDPHYNFNPGDSVFGIIRNSSYHTYTFDLADSISNQIKQSGTLTIDSVESRYKYIHFILDLKLEKGTYKINYTGFDTLNTKQSQLDVHDIIYIK